MDPSIFLQYSPPNGLPQESKLVTYMNHNSSPPMRSLNQSLGKLSLEASPATIKKVLINDYIPVNYFTPASMLPESPESSPPSNLAVAPPNTQVHQENVGGTTYFYSTTDNPGGMTSSGAHVYGAPAGPLVRWAEPRMLTQDTTWTRPGFYRQGVDGCMPAGTSPYAGQMFAGPPPHMGAPAPQPSKSGLTALYSSEAVRHDLYQRNEDVFLQSDPSQFPELPENVDMYTELVPLERGGVAHGPCVFRATHRALAEHRVLRRLPAYTAPAAATAAAKRLEVWKKMDHPNIVRLTEYFTTNAFEDHSMIVAYEYHPGSVTLHAQYLSEGTGGADGTGHAAFADPFSSDPDAPRPYTHQAPNKPPPPQKNAMLRAAASGALLPEPLLWSVLVQLTGALRAVHSAGLACRRLDATKVLSQGGRMRISGCGLGDLTMTATFDVHQAQQEDLSSLGRLALSLAVRAPLGSRTPPAALDLVARTYSPDLTNLLLYLLTPTAVRRSVTDLMPMIGARFYTQVEWLERRLETAEATAARELDNGRLLRLIIKLAAVSDRPELNMDSTWSETGERYMLKLFRDFLFHGVTADGRAYLDHAHLAACLNRLDSGSADKVALMSRDCSSVLVVTYSELKRCLQHAYADLMMAAGPSSGPPCDPTLH